MKMLYINKTFSGPMESVARFWARKPGMQAIFMAEHWPGRGTQTMPEGEVPGLLRLHLPASGGTPPSGASPDQWAAFARARHARNADFVRQACQRLRQSGFVPDAVYATSHDGYAQGVREIFPEARMAARVDWIHGLQGRGGAVRALSPVERLCSASQGAILSACTVGITATEWQRKLLAAALGDKMHAVRLGVDARFFRPAPEAAVSSPSSVPVEEIVTFSCQGANAARGIHIIGQCLPQLLAARPHCRARLLSFGPPPNPSDPRGAAADRARQVDELAALLPAMHARLRERVDIVVSPASADYLDLLQGSTVYVYLAAPTLLSAGLLEAMSSGALVLASDTGSVRELVRDGENGVLWRGRSAEALAQDVGGLLDKAAGGAVECARMREKARATIAEAHDMRTLLPQHAALVLGI